jgi:Sortase domain
VATVGLIVSLAVVWSRLGPEPTVREPGPGPAASATKSTSASPPPAGSSRIGRTEAALVAARPDQEPRPVRATIGSIGIDSPVRAVGVTPDGQMELPPDPRVLGWYEFGTTPGTATGGSVVLAGHLDTRSFGLGPLVRLRETRPGDPVEVTMSDGKRRTYQVSEVERFDRQALPETLFSRSGPERLRVITCGGEYDPETGGYQQNLVVTAVPERRDAPRRR